MADIFISYSRKDLDRIKPLISIFEKRKWSIDIDLNIPGGACVYDDLQEKINNSGCVVVFWSENSVDSEWVKSEAYEAESQSKYQPVLLDNVRKKINFKIRRKQTTDLTSWHGENENAGLSSLLQAINLQLRSPDTFQESNDEPDETEGNIQLPRSRHTKIRQEYQEVFLLHEVRLTKRKILPYDVLIYLRGHMNRGVSHVEKTEFFFGKGFKNEIFKGEQLDDKKIGIKTQVKGEFFCTCSVTFVNGDKVLMNRYIDFGSVT